MATSLLFIKNGLFSHARGKYIRSVQPKFAIVNKWNCKIQEDGTIVCEYWRNYKSGMHTIRFTLQPDGFARTTLKTPNNNNPHTIRKGFVTPKDVKPLNGAIGLVGGDFFSRRVFFRIQSFQDFLDQHGITAVKHKNPNQHFTSHIENNISERYEQYVATNGHIDLIMKKDSSTGLYQKVCSVKNATWTIVDYVKTTDNDQSHLTILYTLVQDIESLDIGENLTFK